MSIRLSQARLSWGHGHKGLVGIVLLALLHAVRAYGAHWTTETFSADSAGWVGSGLLAVAYTNGMLVGRFAQQSIPMPDTGAFLATNVSSGGAFVGNYVEGDIWLIGFSFMAADVLPSSCALRWYGATNSFFRGVSAYMTQTGVWYRFAFPLTSKTSGGWVGGSEESFIAALTNVVGVQVELLRNGTGLQRYYLDDVFLDRLPAGSIDISMETTWAYLRSNGVYTVYAAPEPGAEWEAIATWSATNRMHSWKDPAATNWAQRVYRLAMPFSY